MSEQEPKDPKEALNKIQKDSARILAFTAISVSALMTVVVIVGSWFGYHFYQQITQGRSSTCSFYHDLGTIPLSSSGPTATGRVGVKLIVDARNSFEQRGCGALPPPSRELIQLAEKFGITVR